MRDLLQLAGNRIRSATRADCTRCPGSSTGTVAYTDQVAYCHRCGWGANRAMLERELGLRRVGAGPRARPRSLCAPAGRQPHRAISKTSQEERRLRIEALAAAMLTWLECSVSELAWRHAEVNSCIRRTGALLRRHPQCARLWKLLAVFYERMRRLEEEWEFYFREPLPAYLDHAATLEELLAAWLAAPRQQPHTRKSWATPPPLRVQRSPREWGPLVIPEANAFFAPRCLQRGRHERP
ncbi:MAG: hypothetical protein ACRD5G_13405 [Candidatus Acidiferrales bacterium]